MQLCPPLGLATIERTPRRRSALRRAVSESVETATPGGGFRHRTVSVPGQFPLAVTKQGLVYFSHEASYLCIFYSWGNCNLIKKLEVYQLLLQFTCSLVF